MCAGLLYRGLVAAVVAEMGVTAVVPMSTVEVPGVAVPVAFVGLRGALEANKCQQAETRRAHEREQLRTHWKLLSGRGERGSECPTH